MVKNTTFAIGRGRPIRFAVASLGENTISFEVWVFCGQDKILEGEPTNLPEVGTLGNTVLIHFFILNDIITRLLEVPLVAAIHTGSGDPSRSIRGACLIHPLKGVRHQPEVA